MPSTEREQHTAMTTFQVRCYIKGMPEKGLQKVEAATALHAAEKTYAGPLTALGLPVAEAIGLAVDARVNRAIRLDVLAES